MRLIQLMARTWTARAALLTAVFTLLATLVVNEWSHHRVGRIENARLQLVEARLNSMLLRRLLVEAESAQRGYLLTGREEYLVPYRAATAALPGQLDAMASSLRLLGFDSTGLAAETRRLVDLKRAEIDATISLQRSGKPELAREMVLTNIGMETMAKLQEHLDRVLDQAARQQEAAAARTNREMQARRWVSHALTVLIALAFAIYGRRLALETRQRETERVRLQAEVRAQTAELRDLAAYLQSAQERERALISRELHDELGGLLTAVKLDLARLRTLHERTQQLERLALITKRLDDVIAIKRRIIEDLRPSSLEHLGLRSTIVQHGAEVAERLRIAVDVRVDDVRLPADVEITVYRMVQEALTNVQKYADAKQVRVQVAVSAGQVNVLVADDGAGFNVRTARVNRHGLGGMRYRVEALGGTFGVESAPGRGTRVSATLPVQAPVSGAADAGAGAF